MTIGSRALYGSKCALFPHFSVIAEEVGLTLEKATLADLGQAKRVEDALHATRTAVAEGIVAGGGMDM